MLNALRLRDFALAAHAEIELPPGFSVITGETGAGKSVLIAALSFALGAQADRAMIRPGADRAEVEAEFDLADSPAAASVARTLEDADIPFDGGLILRRSVGASDGGRLTGRIRVNDRAAARATLAALADQLADIHGQREQLGLLDPARQLAILDRYAGLIPARERLAASVARLRGLDARLADAADARLRARKIAQLRYEAAEIETAALRPGEERDLRAELERLANARQLLDDAATARAALESDVLGDALAAVRRIAEIDQAAAPISDALEIALDQAAAASRDVRAYADGIALDPARQADVEARIAAIADLQRRYGETVEQIIEHGRAAEAEADQLEAGAADAELLRSEADALAAEIASDALALSRERRAAAARLAAEVAAECQALRLDGASIQFRFDPLPPTGRPIPGWQPALVDRRGEHPLGEPADSGFDQTGADRLELEASFNPGSPPLPLRRVASGGETARLTLAVKAVLGRRDAVPLLVFDEIDAGLGGRMGPTLAQRLARLAQSHQVLCITHLPQVAAAAAHHIVVRKALLAGAPVVEARPLSPDERVLELADMLGGRSEANLAGARELLGSPASPEPAIVQR